MSSDPRVPLDVEQLALKLATTMFTTREKVDTLLTVCADRHGRILSNSALLRLLSSENGGPSLRTIADEKRKFESKLSLKLRKTKFLMTLDSNVRRVIQESVALEDNA